MLQQKVEIVRQPIRASERPRGRRRLEERFSLRFPGVRAAVNRVLLRLPTRSRIRRFLLRRTIRLAVEASTRGDYEAAFAHFHPDVELNPPADVVTLGSFPASLKGRRERIRFERRWRDDWGDFRYEPDELIDLKDRVLVLGRMIGSGPSSGAASESEWADLVTLSQGQVIREQVFFSRIEAVKAAGQRV
jgi:ketosteroid isomerase-like protein